MQEILREEIRMIAQALRSPYTYIIAMATVGAAYALGLPWQILAILAALSAILTVVDVKHLTLPDLLTLPGIALGLWLAPQYLGISTWDAWLGFGLGGGILGGIAAVYYLIKRKHGMGLGDVKLIAMLGAWGGASLLLPTILIASLTAIVYLPIRMVAKGKRTSQPVPFGPFLILGGWLTLFYGQIFWQNVGG